MAEGAPRLSLVLVSLAVILAMGPLVASAGPPASYAAAEIRGTVVDAETKRPLEGVYVVAQWILNTGLFLHDRHVTRLHILETVTNASGEYHVPAWGPKPRPTLSRLDWGFDPILTFFKPGYRLLSRSNYSPPPENEEEMSVRISRWHGRRVSLQPFRGTPEEWVNQLQAMQIRLSWANPTEESPPRVNDYWKHFPNTVLAVIEQRRMLPLELQSHLSPLDSWGVSEEALMAFLKRRMP